MVETIPKYTITIILRVSFFDTYKIQTDKENAQCFSRVPASNWDQSGKFVHMSLTHDEISELNNNENSRFPPDRRMLKLKNFGQKS